ncbi:PKD domain-containing protein, partial [bacterium]|nr:PKD domain-containing protein [candidate division CSSED10-310 bacterium]
MQKISRGAGSRGGYVFSGSESFNDTDNTGPQISIRPIYDDSRWNANAGFTDKISAFLPVECAITVYDKNGVDVSGIGPDEGLTVELKGVVERQNINDKFTFDEGNNTQGHVNVVYEHDALKPGIYTLTVRAQDLLGKVSMQDFTLEVLSEEDFTLGHVFNYPNPVPVG